MSDDYLDQQQRELLTAIFEEVDQLERLCRSIDPALREIFERQANLEYIEGKLQELQACVDRLMEWNSLGKLVWWNYRVEWKRGLSSLENRFSHDVWVKVLEVELQMWQRYPELLNKWEEERGFNEELKSQLQVALEAWS
jgi:hypothetical protein